jgi:hypothetical protein
MNCSKEINKEWRQWYERMNAMDKGSLEAAWRLPDAYWRICTIKDILSRRAYLDKWQESAHRITWQSKRPKVCWGTPGLARQYQIRTMLNYWE